MSSSSVFLGALATHRLVGRQKELEAIYPAVSPAAGSSFQCLVLKARGGKGKTRLLRETCERLGAVDSANPAAGRWAHEGAVALPLIDLGEIALHPLNGFLREVRNSFALVLAGDREAFADFDQAWLEYEQARDGLADHREVSQRTEALKGAFEQDYAELTRRLRVVWALDTLEQLFAVPPEIKALLDELRLNSDQLEQTTYAWLLQFIAQAPANTTLLLAGRPDPGRWLGDVLARLPGDAPEPLPVEDFTAAETKDYVQYLCEQLQAEPATEPAARNLREMTKDAGEIDYLHQLTGGNPVRLALYIDLFVSAEPMPEALRSLADLSGKSAEEVEAEIRRRQIELDRDLLNYLSRNLSDPEPLVLGYLSVMRRGLDAERLNVLWGERDDAAAASVLKSLQRFSFIKLRGDTLYLHDEFYTIYQEDLARQSAESQEPERERQREIFRRLLNFGEQKGIELTMQIDALRDQVDLLDPSTAEYLEGKQELRRLRLNRRRLRAERLHYELYLNPVEGLNKRYFRFAGQAFLANEPELDELLQSEVTIFFYGANAGLNRIQAGVDEEQWKLLRFHVLHERVARWIKRLITLLLRDEAQQFALRARERHEALDVELYPEVEDLHRTRAGSMLCRLFGQEWEAYRCFAAIYAGKHVRGAVDDLGVVIATLEDELRRDRSDPERPLETQFGAFRWRLLNVLGEALIFAGFGMANLYDFKAAEELYRRAKKIVDHTGFRTLQAEVNNNLSRVLGEIGQLHEALTLCQEGMEVRKAYGFDYLYGLSLNTLALINTRNARPTRSLIYAKEALKLFRQINNPRGIGLALIQVGEAQRRIWGLTAEELRGDPARQGKVDHDLLEVTLPVLREAEQLFSGEFSSPPRQIEVWIELGCLYRDWATFFGLPEAQAEFDQARRLFEQAMALATQSKLSQHYLSAAVNIAWLYGHCGLLAEAKEAAEAAKGVIEPAYLLNTERLIDLTEATNVVNFRELSKLSSLYAVVLMAGSDDLRTLLREHIFAITYLQLFSPYEPFYLGVTKRQLSRLVNRYKLRATEVDRLKDEILHAYHLRGLVEQINRPLQAEQVIQEALNLGEPLDFL